MTDDEFRDLQAKERIEWAVLKRISGLRDEQLSVWAELSRQLKIEELRRAVLSPQNDKVSRLRRERLDMKTDVDRNSAAPTCSSSGDANAAIVEAADRLERLHAALIEIRDSRFCSYENSGSGQYGIGVADGHRYCANVARTAIG